MNGANETGDAHAAEHALRWLRVQVEWGADEALVDEPVDRRLADRPPAAAAGIAPSPLRGQVAGPRADGSGTTSVVSGEAAIAAGGPVTAARLAVAAANDLASLEAAVHSFRATPLRRTAGAVVFSAGAPAAAITVVVDAPSAADDASGLPLSGDDGRLVARMLASIAVAAEATRLACLVPWRPPGDRAPTATEIATGEVFLRGLLRLVPSRAVLLFGPAAARTLTGTTGSMRSLVGRVLDLPLGPGGAVLPTVLLPPPAALGRDPRAKRLAWEALLTLAERLFPLGSNTIA